MWSSRPDRTRWSSPHIAGKEVFARLRADAEAKPGDMLPLVFNLDKAVYFDPETGTRLQ